MQILFISTLCTFWKLKKKNTHLFDFWKFILLFVWEVCYFWNEHVNLRKSQPRLLKYQPLFLTQNSCAYLTIYTFVNKDNMIEGDSPGGKKTLQWRTLITFHNRMLTSMFHFLLWWFCAGCWDSSYERKIFQLLVETMEEKH